MANRAFRRRAKQQPGIRLVLGPEGQLIQRPNRAARRAGYYEAQSKKEVNL